MFKNYNIQSVKIGIIPSLHYLNQILSTIKLLSPATKIVWDPVLKSTTKFEFIKMKDQFDLNQILSKIDLITPNYNEMEVLFPGFISDQLWLQNQIPTSVLL